MNNATTAMSTFTFTGWFASMEPVLVGCAAIATVIGVGYSIYHKRKGQ